VIRYLISGRRGLRGKGVELPKRTEGAWVRNCGGIFGSFALCISKHATNPPHSLWRRIQSRSRANSVLFLGATAPRHLFSSEVVGAW
jgi:hypothetical protein